MTWGKVKLKTLLSQPVKNGYSPVCPDTPNGKWVLSLGALTDSGFDITQLKPAPTDDRKVDDFVLSSGDFLISRSNTRDKVGRSALFKGQIERCSYPDLMMRFRVKVTDIFPEFLEMYLRSHEAVRHFQRSASGTSGSMVKINKSIVENLLVPQPPILEQTAIADLLSTWDIAIGKTEHLIAAKQQQFKGLMQQLLSGKRRFPRFSDSWRNIKFGEIFAPSKTTNDKGLKQEVLSVTKDGLVRQSDYFNKEVASADKRKYLVVQRGDMVMSGLNFWMGSIDFQHICDKGLVSPAYKAFKIKNKLIDPSYMRFFVRSSFMTRILIRSSVQGASIVRRNLDMAELNESYIKMPSMEEQNAIASMLLNVELELKLLQQQRDSFKEQKKGLMQQLLKGKIRVKVDKEDVA